mmetsp:Transcript_7494/g.17709  ORF Transcript_7494/g.17709 Transcript_7494/m.17709 type:complete len:132 (+) Transcript_7494:85-480(+)
MLRATASATRAALTRDVDDGRSCLEWMLLPPGMTFSRAAASGIFFLMLYCFVFTSWYAAVGGVTCTTEKLAADIAEAEVEKLRLEVSTLENRARQPSADRWKEAPLAGPNVAVLSDPVHHRFGAAEQAVLV